MLVHNPQQYDRACHALHLTLRAFETRQVDEKDGRAVKGCENCRCVRLDETRPRRTRKG